MAKREQGYVVTVKMFVPVNAKDLNDTKAKADAIMRAKESNDLSGLVSAGADVMNVDQRWTSREKPVPGEPAPEVEQEGGDQGDGQTDIEETIEQEQARIRAEHEAREAAAEAEENGSVGDRQTDAVEEAASGGTSGRRRRV